MKTWIAIIACCAVLLAAVSALGEPGDEPNCPWEYMTALDVAHMEEIREAQIVGGVKGSPYWLWQAYLGSGSLQIRLYDVQEPVFPKQLLFKERVSWSDDSSKTMTLTARSEQENLELRMDRWALTSLEAAGIDTVEVYTTDGKLAAQYAREDLVALFDYFGVADGAFLCVQGEDAPLFLMDEDGYRRALTAQ